MVQDCHYTTDQNNRCMVQHALIILSLTFKYRTTAVWYNMVITLLTNNYYTRTSIYEMLDLLFLPFHKMIQLEKINLNFNNTHASLTQKFPCQEQLIHKHKTSANV